MEVMVTVKSSPYFPRPESSIEPPPAEDEVPQATQEESRETPNLERFHDPIICEQASACKYYIAMSRRLVRRKGASWSLIWPSGANSLAHLQLKCILYVPL